LKFKILALPFLAFARLPLWLVYLHSDIIYILLYYVVGYRKDVVMKNLQNSFPTKTKEELVPLSKAYFRFMVDMIHETFKALGLSKEELQKRVIIENIEVIEKLKKQNRSIIIAMGHHGNWEWGNLAFQLLGIYNLRGLYHPLSNKFFDELVIKIRSKFGTVMIPTSNTLKEFVNRKNEVHATGFLTDQTPSSDQAYWMNFLNQDTAIYIGTEKIARKFNYPVIFASIIRIKRGYYKLSFSVISDNPAESGFGFITEKHTRILEEEIIKQPETWLWSHRRWKHKRPAYEKIKSN